MPIPEDDIGYPDGYPMPPVYRQGTDQERAVQAAVSANFSNLVNQLVARQRDHNRADAMALAAEVATRRPQRVVVGRLDNAAFNQVVDAARLQTLDRDWMRSVLAQFEDNVAGLLAFISGTVLGGTSTAAEALEAAEKIVTEISRAVRTDTAPRGLAGAFLLAVADTTRGQVIPQLVPGPAPVASPTPVAPAPAEVLALRRKRRTIRQLKEPP